MQRSRLCWADRKDALDGFRSLPFLRCDWFDRSKEVSRGRGVRAIDRRIVRQSALFFLAIDVRNGMPRLRPLVEAGGRDEAATFREWFTPHLAVGEPVGLRVDRGELLELVFRLCKPEPDASAHHHQLSALMAAPRRDVPVGRDRAGNLDVLDVEVLDDLPFVEEAVVAATHR
jgi:hypothetical protein